MDRSVLQKACDQLLSHGVGGGSNDGSGAAVAAAAAGGCGAMKVSFKEVCY